MRGSKSFINQALLQRLLLVSLLGATRMVAAEGVATAPTDPVPGNTPSTASSAPDSAAVMRTLADGDRLSRAGDWNAALGVYRKVHQVTPSHESQQRIASALDRLGQYGEAYAAYAELLDRYTSQLTTDRRNAAESRLRELDELTGIVVFESLDNQATVRINGALVDPARLTRPLRVNRGAVEFEIARQGHSTKSFSKTITVGIQRIDGGLSPLSLETTGTLAVTATTPAEVTLMVDGRAIGPLPQRLELRPGTHEISATGPAVEARPVRVQIEQGKSMTIGLDFIAKPGIFDINPVEADAVLFVDQQPKGAGKRRVSLSPGRHELEIRRPGYKSQRLSIDVRPGQQQQLTAAAYVVDPTTAPAGSAPQFSTPSASPPPTNAAAQPAAVAPESNAAPPSNYTGIFGSFIVPIMLGGKSTHSYVDDCPAKAYGGACTTSAPRGGGLGLRLGYFYEWIGLELIGAGAVDVSTTELKLPPIPTISSSMQDAAGRNVFVRAGGMVGIGARLAIPMQGLRFTVGADYLYIYRKVIAIPDSFAGASLSYSVPGWFIDGGIQLGSTPGARFYIGAFALIEQAHDLPLSRNLAALGIDPALVPAELTQMTVYRGRQVFFGPLLGIAFGH